MDKNYFIQLTLGLYRVTDIFPDKEPLKYKIREKANEILAHLAGVNFDPLQADSQKVIEDLNIINIYFDVAQSQDWIDSRNFLVLKQGYANIREIFFQKIVANPPIKETKSEARQVSYMAPKPRVQSRTKPARTINESLDSNGSRKDGVLSLLQDKGPMRLIQLVEHFPGISLRTLRRDLVKLVKTARVERYDEGKLTFYKSKSLIKTI